MYSFAAPGAPGQPDRDKQGIARARILVMTATDEQLAQILTGSGKDSRRQSVNVETIFYATCVIVLLGLTVYSLPSRTSLLNA